MQFTTILGLFLGSWSVLYFLDLFARVYHFNAYIRFAERTGLSVGAFQIRWYSSRVVQLASTSRLLRNPRIRRFFDNWFTLGVGFGVLSMLMMLIFLSNVLITQLASISGSLALIDVTEEPSLKQTFSPVNAYASRRGASSMSSIQQQNSAIVPVIPGVNVPWSQVPLFFFVLIISGILHEAGHAIAALNENVTVEGFGVFILGVYPGAFTHVDTESLHPLKPFRRLKVFCAGIWHNFVLAFLCILLIYLLPFLMTILGYRSNQGILVTAVDENSGLGGQGGLKSGMILTQINGCPLTDTASWQQCLSDISRTNYGYCVPRKDLLNAEREAPSITITKGSMHGEVECCDQNKTASHLCFYYHQFVNETNLVNKKQLNQNSLSNIFEYACLPARYVTHHYPCNYSMPCANMKTTCVYTGLFNNTKLFRFTVQDQSTAVLFVGYTNMIARSVEVSNYVPTWFWTPIYLPYYLELTFKYFVTFSLALALLNAMPCYSLDGQHMLAVLVEMLGYGKKWRKRKDLIYRCVLVYATFVLVANVIVALFNFVKSGAL